MTDEEKGPTVATSTSKSLGWIFAAILAVALISVVYLAYTGFFNNDQSVSIELQVPQELTPSE